MPGKQDGSAIAGIKDVCIALDGPQALGDFVENISKDERQHRGLSAPLRSGRDDKGEGGVSSCDWLLVKRTADSSTARRDRSASLGGCDFLISLIVLVAGKL